MEDFKNEINLIASDFLKKFKGYGNGQTSALAMYDRINREQMVILDFNKIFSQKARERFNDDSQDEELKSFYDTTLRQLILDCHKKQ